MILNKFLDRNELLKTIGSNNSIFDAHSVLISPKVVIGSGNTFYPNVVIELDSGGSIKIGNGNIFYPGTYIISTNGSVVIHNNNEFGPGGCVVRTSTVDDLVTIGSNGRYNANSNIIGKCDIGDGSQILGPINVQDCTLESGNDYREHDPDVRAAVLKGFGIAKGVNVSRGHVINGSGDFKESAVEWQHVYHPKK